MVLVCVKLWKLVTLLDRGFNLEYSLLQCSLSSTNKTSASATSAHHHLSENILTLQTLRVAHESVTVKKKNQYHGRYVYKEAEDSGGSVFTAVASAGVLSRIQGETPLHHAAFFGHLAVPKLLLKHGAKVDSQNNNG